jgi:hypothetical protein
LTSLHGALRRAILGLSKSIAMIPANATAQLTKREDIYASGTAHTAQRVEMAIAG